MAQHDPAPAPWESGGEYTAFFDQVVKKRTSNTNDRNVSDHSKKTTAKDVLNPETKSNDVRPVMKEDVDARPGTTHKRNPGRADYNDNRKVSNRTNATTYPGKPAGRSIMSSDRRLPTERAPVSRRNTAAAYAAPDRDVIVPPFPTSDGNDPTAEQNFTGIFNAVADRTGSKAPFTPSNQNSQSGDAKNKGHGIWQWFLGCFGGH